MLRTLLDHADDGSRPPALGPRPTRTASSAGKPGTWSLLGAGAAHPAELGAHKRSALGSLPRLLRDGLGVNLAAWSGPQQQQGVIGWQTHTPDSRKRVRHPRSTTPQTPAAEAPGTLRQPAANETDLVLLAWMAATAPQRPLAHRCPHQQPQIPEPPPTARADRRKRPLAHQPALVHPFPARTTRSVMPATQNPPDRSQKP